MRILILVVLAIVAYILFKKFTAKNQTDSPALDNKTLDNETTGNTTGVNEIGESQPGQADSSLAKTADTVMPASGDKIADIQEMFKILNLRSSDAPRLSLTPEQYEGLKSGQSTGLGNDILDTVLNRLRAML